jgi:Zn finger protein HypA/HybF involved in hydrogenase expression
LADKLKKKKTVEVEQEPRRLKCTVCGSDVAPNSEEGLCWVCRRLKISAWADSDNQAPMQE